MDYQVLARKWRPKNFAEVAGQAHVLKSLINALDSGRLHHAYLFTGTRGVGKTTLARILAKCLNCEKGVSATPCGECGACVELAEGRFMDLIEVDAASRTKVDDTRELLENVQYTPTRGRFKVYLIDEVHMLSNHSFNALLKTLEEPPPHVKFLFATTDPQKLPVTILSRCLQFHLKNLPPKLIVDYLGKVLVTEEVEHEADALWQLATAAAGSMRDALTLTDQAISYCQGKVGQDGVVEMLGIPDRAQVRALLEAIAARNVSAALEVVADMAARTPDYLHTLDNLLTALHRVAIAQILPNAIDNSFGDRDFILGLAKDVSAEDLQLYYQMGVAERGNLRLATEMREAFEMLLLRMMVFSPQYSATDGSGSSASQEGRAGAPAQSTPAAAGQAGQKVGQMNGLGSRPGNGSAGQAWSRPAEDAPRDGAAAGAPARSTPAAASQAGWGAGQMNGPGAGQMNGSASQARSRPAEDALRGGAAAAPPVPEPPAGSAPAVRKPTRAQDKPSAASRQAAKVPENPSAVAGPVNGAVRSPQDDGTRRPAIPWERLDAPAWVELARELPANGLVRNILLNSVFHRREGDTLHLTVDQGVGGGLVGDGPGAGEGRSRPRNKHVASIEQALGDYFGSAVRVQLNCGELASESAAQQARRMTTQRRDQLLESFTGDANVRQFVAHFSGIILKDTIEEVQSSK